MTFACGEQTTRCCFTTRRSSRTNPPGTAFVSRGAAWSFEKEPGVYHGPPNEMHDYSMKLFEQRDHAATGNYGSDDVPVFFDMEIMIRAQKLAHAQHAMNLLVSAMAALEGSITFAPDPFSIEPRAAGTAPPTTSYLSRSGLLDVCVLANRASRKRSSSYALHKLALSYQSSSPHLMDLHPDESPRRFRVQSDPIYHVYLANAVTLACGQVKRIRRRCRTAHGIRASRRISSIGFKCRASTCRIRISEPYADPRRASRKSARRHPRESRTGPAAMCAT